MVPVREPESLKIATPCLLATVFTICPFVGGYCSREAVDPTDRSGPNCWKPKVPANGPEWRQFTLDFGVPISPVTKAGAKPRKPRVYLVQEGTTLDFCAGVLLIPWGVGWSCNFRSLSVTVPFYELPLATKEQVVVFFEETLSFHAFGPRGKGFARRSKPDCEKGHAALSTKNKKAFFLGF